MWPEVENGVREAAHVWVSIPTGQTEFWVVVTLINLACWCTFCHLSSHQIWYTACMFCHPGTFCHQVLVATNHAERFTCCKIITCHSFISTTMTCLPSSLNMCVWLCACVCMNMWVHAVFIILTSRLWLQLYFFLTAYLLDFIKFLV